MNNVNEMNLNQRQVTRLASPAISLKRDKSKSKVITLTKLDKLVITLTVIVTLGLLIVNLLTQINIATNKYGIENLQNATLELNANTDNIVYLLSDQYDYQVIKEVAKEAGLTIDSQRVRSFD